MTGKRVIKTRLKKRKEKSSNNERKMTHVRKRNKKTCRQSGGRMNLGSLNFFPMKKKPNTNTNTKTKSKTVKVKETVQSQDMFAKAVTTCLSKEHFENLHKRNGFVAVHATGTGKTFTGSIVIKNFLELDPSAKIVLVVPEKLMANWKDEIENLNVSLSKKSYLTYVTHEKFKDTCLGSEDAKHSKDRIFIVDEAHLLIKDYFRDEEFMEIDTNTMEFQHLSETQQNLLTLSRKNRGVVLLTATPIVHSILDLRWMYNIARGYDDTKTDEQAKVPINRFNFCNKFTEVNAKYEVFKKIVDFLNSEGVQSSISRLVMLSQKSSRTGLDTLLLTGNLLSLATGLENVSTQSTQHNEKRSLTTRRVNELVQKTVSNYQMGSMLYNLIRNTQKGSNTSSTQSYVYLYVVMLAMYLISSLLSKQLNSIKYPGEKDLFLTREPKKNVIKGVLNGTFHFYEVSKEESSEKGFPTEVRIDGMMVDYTLEQRFLFYRFCNGQLTEEDCNLLSIPHEKRVLVNEEERTYQLQTQSMGRTDDQEYYGLKIGNLSLTTDSVPCVKFTEVFKKVKSMDENVRRVGFYSNYSDSIVEFNKFLLVALEEDEEKRAEIKKTFESLFFLDRTTEIENVLPKISGMCDAFDDETVVESFSTEHLGQMSNIVDSEDDAKYIEDYNDLFELKGKGIKTSVPLTIARMKVVLKKMSTQFRTSDKFLTSERIVKFFNNVQRWSLYFLNKRYNVFYLGDVNDSKRIVNEFNDKKLGHTGYILLHPKWIEGITLKRVQQFHILEPPIVYANKMQIRGRVARFETHEDKDPNLNKVWILEWICNDNLLTSFLTSERSSGSPIKARKEDTKSSSLFREVMFYGKQYLSPLQNIKSILLKALKLFTLNNFSAMFSYIGNKSKLAAEYYVNPMVEKSNIIPASLESLVMGRSGGLENLFNLLKNGELTNIETCGDANCKIVLYEPAKKPNSETYCVRA